VNEAPALRVSDAERERAIVELREHAVEGRLTLEEFTDRMSVAAEATTKGELEALTRDLPATPAPGSRLAPTRVVGSLFGHTRRQGRMRVQGRVVCLTGFGAADLDLRQALLDGDTITVVVLGAFGHVGVTVPEGIEVDLSGVSLLGHKGLQGHEPVPRAGTPIVHVVVCSLFSSVEVNRVAGEPSDPELPA
jgi:hypothetical protein